MLVLDEIIKQLGGMNRFREIGPVRLGSGGRLLIVEHIGFGPTSRDAVRLTRYADSRVLTAEPEIHFEWRDTVWMPYYCHNQRTGTELFLYGFTRVNEPLRLNFQAGTRLIEIGGFLEINLWAEGFVEAARDVLQPSLFSVRGGAA